MVGVFASNFASLGNTRCCLRPLSQDGFTEELSTCPSWLYLHCNKVCLFYPNPVNVLHQCKARPLHLCLRPVLLCSSRQVKGLGLINIFNYSDHFTLQSNLDCHLASSIRRALKTEDPLRMKNWLTFLGGGVHEWLADFLVSK